MGIAFLVEGTSRAASRHALHTVSAPHLFTLRPQPGDVIVSSWRLDFLVAPRVEIHLYGEGILVDAQTHHAQLGEEGDSEVGTRSVLPDLLEELARRRLDTSWIYAPCELRPGPRWSASYEQGGGFQIEYYGAAIEQLVAR